MLLALTFAAFAQDPDPTWAPAPPAAPAEPVAPVDAPPPVVPPPPAPPPAPEPWVRPVPEPRAALDDHFEVSVALGSIGTRGDDVSLFNDGSYLGSKGLRVGWRPVRRLVVYGDWQRGRTGKELGFSSEDDAGTVEDVVATLVTNQVALGARVDTTALYEWVRPYATIAALGVQGTARFDDDTGEPDSPGQIAHGGFAPGGVAALGVAGRVAPVAEVDVGGQVWLEMGYAAVLPLGLGDLGPIRMGGFVVRSGLGLVF